MILGHGCQEEVSVSVLMYTRGYSPVVLGSCPVTYRENLTCKLSRFLVNHTECITASSHKVLLDKFGLTIKELQSLDNDLTMAIAHEELPSTWNILGSYSEGGKILFLVGRLLVVTSCIGQSRVSQHFIEGFQPFCFILWLWWKVVWEGYSEIWYEPRSFKNNCGYCNLVSPEDFCTLTHC